MLLAGAARIAMADEEIARRPGGHLFVPAGAEHRVTFTGPDRPTVRLAVHIGETDAATGG